MIPIVSDCLLCQGASPLTDSSYAGIVVRKTAPLRSPLQRIHAEAPPESFHSYSKRRGRIDCRVKPGYEAAISENLMPRRFWIGASGGSGRLDRGGRGEPAGL